MSASSEILISALDPPAFAAQNSDSFPIVGIGASAGGLEALERLFARMPADSGMAFVVIQHLSPDFRSLMDELLARHTRVPILKVENGMTVAPNTIYLMPPKTEMIISGGKLLLTDKEPSNNLSLPIDLFFRSLAEDIGSRAVGVVLSGTGSDGSRGVRAIHEAGGLVIAQSEETSKFDGMPRSTIETGLVDFVLAPEEIPQTLVKFSQQALGIEAAVDERIATAAENLSTVFSLLRKACGIDFTHYKPNMVSRRIERRLLFNQSLDLAGYIRQLESDPAELNALYKDLLIGVTRFFRDTAAFDRLEKDILPALISRIPENQEIRVWVAGCATGEEAYSLAIVLSEQLRLLQRENPLKIFATDVHRESLEFAGAGKFSEVSITGIRPAWLERYFIKQGNSYQVSPDLRKAVVFAPHNVIRDAPFTKLDLISCRNLLIYLQPAAQRKALSLFHFGLKSQGVLLLGPSESPGELSEEYEVLDPHWKVYRKRRDVRLVNDLPIATSPYAPSTSLPRSSLRGVSPTDSEWPRISELLLNEVMPPSILLDEQHKVLHSFGGAGKYLAIRDGRHSNDVLALVSGELKLAIGSLLQRVSNEKSPVSFGPIRVGDGADLQWITISARPVLVDRPRTLVIFTPQSQSVVATTTEPAAIDLPAEQHRELLENELRYTRENLQATVEELETANEELQATNEELVASNEELQSTNEELHSVNEELYTVNAEYQRKIVELTELTDDIENLLRTTEVGVIFLDRELRIRRFTPPIATLFPLQPQDVGRRLEEFSSAIRHDHLLRDVASVLANGARHESEVEDGQGKSYLLRILPYLTKAGIEGVVLTLVDISTLKRTEAHLARLSSLVENSDEAIVSRDLEGRVVSCNKAAVKLYQYTPEELIGKSVDSLASPEETTGLQELWRKVCREGATSHVESKRLRKDGTVVEVLLTLAPIRDARHAIVGVSDMSHEITQRKHAERQLARLALVANRTDNLVVITDAAGKIEWVNDAFSRLTEYPLDEVRGRKPGEFLQGPETDPKVVALMHEYLQRREGFNVEVLNYAKSGRKYWIAIEARPVFNEFGAVSGFVAIETDVTQRKQVEKEAREAIERRDRFLAMLSHELRNPLGAIVNAGKVIERGVSDPQCVAQGCGVIQRQSVQMARLLDDLLDVARVTQGKIQLAKETLNLTSLATDVLEIIEPLAAARRQQLDVRIPQGTLWIQGDRLRLQQIQVNLLTNAVKYTPRCGSIRFLITQEEKEAVIRVEDSGMGIPHEMLPQIFDLFVQCHETVDRADGGIGVGLTLVRYLVDLHGGAVTAHSDGPGQGSQLTVRLPLTDAPRPNSSPESAPAQVAEVRRIAIIEDNSDSRDMLYSLLRMDGYDVVAARDGIEGLALIQTHQPDVALVDIGLPGIDGFEVARRVRASLGNEILLIALTGYGREEDRRAVLAAGFNEHLVKPLDPDDLVKILSARRA